ncbi:MAG: type IV pili twitching motility protein PilT [Nitrospirae bacterium CG_4_10_14_0_8_um_filter_41_23]|nr:type IV pilus twitching motility protein PilT [Nitrospirota bacterium]OIP61086.1 MAG: type IV pili twitching motility protein PilT [Nitrospirae bacterium CG2_30_41_42]PIQ94864.1 MAG: type IV pili twitching motility protein PilT [Nitrospirae bacterium CG11_big_fil_rev_8_21_14_0_20_41_14]PIV40980.1 MAG: type IV pili twitching motility protein PilT [Nitrospirae bacterium CG02_land_8_20_14_3_00_41_53]PIW88047.1 MAG: type IV pili twitching motility protein PilT [Nitrospirae bacterium CG_4_8_14_3_
MDINELLEKAHSLSASDLHIKVGSPPILRIYGELTPLTSEKRLSQEDTMKIAFSVMTPGQSEIFKKKNDIDLAYSVPGLGRFRCNIFIQRGTIGVVFRVIPMRIPSIEELFLPEIIKKICMERRGLILVTGTSSSGKSTTLAAMIDLINTMRTEHIITIEDPIEYLHMDKKSIVNQREIGSDTESFSKALRQALRQDPDVILVGEMRDFETIQTALVAAETGHLVLSTLHTIDATETINRIISVFPPYQHKQVRMQLASVLKGIISMRLMPRADGKGRVPAVEVLVATTTIKDCILDPDKTRLIPDVLAQGIMYYGMQTFDHSLFSLFKSGLITYEEAIRGATNPDDFALKVKGIQSTSDLTFEEPAEKDKMKIDRFAR